MSGKRIMNQLNAITPNNFKIIKATIKTAKKVPIINLISFLFLYNLL